MMPDRNIDPVVGEFLRKCETKDPREAMKEKVRQLKAEHLSSAADSVPVDAGSIARLCGVHVCVVSDLSRGGRREARAVLSPIAGGFRVLLSESFSESSRNMTIAHEIAHTFFYDIVGRVPQRPYGLSPTALEEELCEFGARTIMLPEEYFAAYFSSEVTSISEALYSAARFARVTLRAAAQRLVEDLTDLSESLGIEAVIMWTARDANDVSQEAIRPRWSVGKYFVPMAGRCHAKEGSVVHRAFWDPSVRGARSGEEVRIGSLKGVFGVDVFSTDTRPGAGWMLACYSRRTAVEPAAECAACGLVGRSSRLPPPPNPQVHRRQHQQR